MEEFFPHHFRFYLFWIIFSVYCHLIYFLNYEWKTNGVLFPIEEVVSVDCTTFIWQVLCDTYPEKEILSHLHEATILQLFILLPYEIDEAKIESFDFLYLKFLFYDYTVLLRF